MPVELPAAGFRRSSCIHLVAADGDTNATIDKPQAWARSWATSAAKRRRIPGRSGAPGPTRRPPRQLRAARRARQVIVEIDTDKVQLRVPEMAALQPAARVRATLLRTAPLSAMSVPLSGIPPAARARPYPGRQASCWPAHPARPGLRRKSAAGVQQSPCQPLQGMRSGTVRRWALRSSAS